MNPTTYLTKLQSNDERDRLAEKLTKEINDEPLKACLQANIRFSWDARTKDVEILCDVVGIFREAVASVIINSHDIIAKKRCSEALKEVDQLITERIEG